MINVNEATVFHQKEKWSRIFMYLALTAKCSAITQAKYVLTYKPTKKTHLQYK